MITEIKSLLKYDEVILWFESDLFCQINFVACVSILAQLDYKGKVFGVFGPEDFEFDLSSYQSSEFSLFEIMELSEEEVTLCDLVWKIYCSPDHDKFNAIIDRDEFGQLAYLKEALLAHFDRFPRVDRQFNEVELMVKKGIEESNNEYKSLMRYLLTRGRKWGYGDSQYDQMLKSLTAIIGEEPYVFEIPSDFRKGSVVYGGVEQSFFEFNSKKKKLEKI